MTIIKNDKNIKTIKSENYNLYFNKNNGLIMRWGKNKKQKPYFCEMGPELLNIEISTVCSNECPYCYKSNTKNGKNMSFNTFQRILRMLMRDTKALTKINFEIGDINANPDIWEIFNYTKQSGIISNVTINGKNITDNEYNNLVKYCEEVSVSNHDIDVCLNTVKKLTDKGLKKVNIHQLLSKATLNDCYELMNLLEKDERLKKSNSIVFLSIKEKGRGAGWFKPSREESEELINYILNNNIKAEFDNCFAPIFIDTIKKHKNYEKYTQIIECCESTLFSIYINVDGISFPCSFIDGVKGYKGIDVLKQSDFLKDVWYSDIIQNFRISLISQKYNHCDNYRMCPTYNLYN